jgi:hypothetical protein
MALHKCVAIGLVEPCTILPSRYKASKVRRFLQRRFGGRDALSGDVERDEAMRERWGSRCTIRWVDVHGGIRGAGNVA